jgi:hypothetical protein
MQWDVCESQDIPVISPQVLQRTHISSLDIVPIAPPNGKPNTLSRHPALRLKKGGTIIAETSALRLKPEQFIKIAGIEQELGRTVLASIDNVQFGAEFLGKV